MTDRIDALIEAAEDRLPKESTYPASSRSQAVTARIGRWLGITFGVCMLTGLVSHFIQHPWPGPSLWPGSPSWLYAVTQGVHVTAGVASIPLLAMKLWSVAPKFWQRPLFGGLLHTLERLSILALVAASIFQLVTGLANVAHAYLWRFFFPEAHFAIAFVATGAIVLHIAVKLPVIRAALGAPDEPVRPGALNRRGVLTLAAGGAGLAVAATVGDKISVLSPISVYAQRTGEGPQGVPVNKSARSAGVIEAASAATWTLGVVGRRRSVQLSRSDLASMTSRTAWLPIACVEGWSAGGSWTGVPLRDLLALVDEDPTELEVQSLQDSRYGRSNVSATLAAHPDALIALQLNGEDLHIDHGFPARLVAPNRPGVMQTKWLTRIEVV